MGKKHTFERFSDAQQKQYEREARLQWGPEKVNESVQRWGGYSDIQREAILEEGGQIYAALAQALTEGQPPNSPVVQKLLVRWQHHLRHFYEPTLEILRGLGETYRAHPEFNAFFQKLHPDLPAYLQEAITQYVDDLETAEIERMLAEDAARR